MTRRLITQNRFRKNQDGITSLEFALISPVMVMLIMGIIEFSMVMYTTTIMESATNSTSRLGKTGYDPSGMTRQEAIVHSITEKTKDLLDGAKITIETKAYSDFSKVGKPEPCIDPVNPPCGGLPGINYIDANGNGTWDSDMAEVGLGNEGEVVVYSVHYPWKIMTPFVSSLMGASIFDITVRTVVRNEPFGTPAGR